MSKTLYNAEKASQLGMPFGTATHRLRKMLLFNMAQRLNEDLCFKCNQKIEKVEDFTIEHKKPWLHNDPALFWALDNIAYSHSWCNKPDRPGGGGVKLRREPPPGMNWCGRHKKFLPVENFNKSKHRWTGYHCLCKECDHYTRK